MEVMSILKRTLILAGCVAALGLGTATLMAGRGAGGGGGFGGGAGFNPQAQLDTYRQAMNVTDDAEWTAISAAITKVTTARAAAMGGFGGRGGRGGRGGAGGAPAAAPAATPLTDAIAALQKTLDDKAPTADIKAAIAKVEGIKKTNQTAYEQAQDDLRKLLKAPQEGYLVTQGVL